MSGKVIQVVDLGFGDAGKGSMVDYLAMRHDAEWVVRFNGGPQAAHNVVLPDGRHHTFAQFGSASFQPRVRTLLSRFMLIDPYAMLNEAAHLSELGAGEVMSRTLIDERCLVITPPQQIANRLRERARAGAAHGTCGMGIGQCVEDSINHPEDALRGGDLRDPIRARRKLETSLERNKADVREWISLATPQERRVLDDPSWIDTALRVYREIVDGAHLIDPAKASTILRESSSTIFEGSQGVLLDERFGFYPHTTWSRTTFTNADELLDESGVEAVRLRLGVIRPYLVRHGNGPLVTEDGQLGRNLTEPHNRDDGYPGKFRRGLLDLVMLRFAIRACGDMDGIALTCMDHLPHLPAIACGGYDLNHRDFPLSPSEDLAQMARLTELLEQVRPRYQPWPCDSAGSFVAGIESELGISVLYQSHGPTRNDKRENSHRGRAC